MTKTYAYIRYGDERFDSEIKFIPRIISQYLVGEEIGDTIQIEFSKDEDKEEFARYMNSERDWTVVMVNGSPGVMFHRYHIKDTPKSMIRIDEQEDTNSIVVTRISPTSAISDMDDGCVISNEMSGDASYLRTFKAYNKKSSSVLASYGH